jgi:hypothetical protein
VFDGLEGIRVIQTATVPVGLMVARLLADWGDEYCGTAITLPVWQGGFSNDMSR